MNKVLVDRELRAAVTAQPAEAEGVQPWRERIIAAHPKSEPGYWHDELLVAYMQPEIEELRAALSAVTAERDRLQASEVSLAKDLGEALKQQCADIRTIDQLRAEVESMRKDAARLDRLDIECEAYGCEGIHEGNRWIIDGPFRTVRDAIDSAMAAKEA